MPSRRLAAVVVGGAEAGVPEGVVGFLELDELVAGVGLGVDVRMPFARQASVGLGDLVRGGGGGDAQELVVVREVKEDADAGGPAGPAGGAGGAVGVVVEVVRDEAEAGDGLQGFRRLRVEVDELQAELVLAQAATGDPGDAGADGHGALGDAEAEGADLALSKGEATAASHAQAAAGEVDHLAELAADELGLVPHVSAARIVGDGPGHGRCIGRIGGGVKGSGVFLGTWRR